MSLVLSLLFLNSIALAETTSSGWFNFFKPEAEKPLANHCKELAPGESAVVNENWNKSPTGVERKYRLTRKPGSEKKYTVDINLSFEPLQKYLEENYGMPRLKTPVFKGARDDQEDPRDNARAQYLYKAKTCLQKYSSQLSSSDGVNLDFNIHFDKPESFAPLVKIGIDNKDHRSHSRAWSSGIDCPTIVHEMLHLVGLCDGYHEKSKLKDEKSKTFLASLGSIFDFFKSPKSKTKYDCRHVEPNDSVMSNQWNALEAKYNVFICDKPGYKGPNVKIEQDLESCPGGKSMQYGKNVLPQVLLACDQKYWKDRLIFYREIPPPKHALFPGHTRLITQPHCGAGNIRYIKCSRNAYRTRSQEGCEKSPPECNGSGLLQ